MRGMSSSHLILSPKPGFSCLHHGGSYWAMHICMLLCWILSGFFAQKPPAGVTVSVSLNGLSPDASRGATSQREDAVSGPAEPPEAAAQGLFVSKSRQTTVRALSVPSTSLRPSKALRFHQRRTAVKATQLGSRGQCRPQRPGAGRPKLCPFSVQHIYIETQP